jgi:hypothetical protein
MLWILVLFSIFSLEFVIYWYLFVYTLYDNIKKGGFRELANSVSHVLNPVIAGMVGFALSFCHKYDPEEYDIVNGIFGVRIFFAFFSGIISMIVAFISKKFLNLVFLAIKKN